MTQPTVLLCPGAQKSGTTWLHRYVVGSDGVAPTLMKEFHVWSTLYAAPDDPPIIFEGRAAKARHELHRQMVENPEAYFDYFASLVTEPGKWLASDITPAYAGLPAEAFERIRSGFSSRGIAVRIVFLMRDPVERCWSAVRMYRHKNLPIPGVGHCADEQEALRRYCGTGHAQRHGRYERTIKAIERAFDPREYWFGLYETLFDPESIADLSGFIGVDPRPDSFRDYFNVSAKTLSLTEDTRRDVADAYAETLRYCWDRFPSTRSIWPSHALIDWPAS